MRPNRFSIHRICNIDGYKIIAEKRSLFFTMEYSLIINGVKQDQLLGTYGIFVLHGMIQENEIKKPLEIIIHQGLLRSKFFCKVDNITMPMKKYKPDNG